MNTDHDFAPCIEDGMHHGTQRHAKAVCPEAPKTAAQLDGQAAAVARIVAERAAAVTAPDLGARIAKRADELVRGDLLTNGGNLYSEVVSIERVGEDRVRIVTKMERHGKTSRHAVIAERAYPFTTESH